MGTADLNLTPERSRGVMAADDDSEPDLTAFQLEVARLFFALPASRGFLLAVGAALLAQYLTTRPTEDLDFFTTPERGQVPAARDALEAAVRERGWTAQRIHDSDTFCRMVVRSVDTEVLVDLAVNAPPSLPASTTAAGPTLAPEELAGHKLLARAAQIDVGFDANVLANMMATLDRFTDDEIPVPDRSSAADLRAFYATWRSELAA
jgi:hypothetical protein